MAPLRSVPVGIVAAMMVMACRARPGRDVRTDAGPPTLTGATVESGEVDAAAVDATTPERAPPAATGALRVPRFGGLVEDIGDDRGARVSRLLPGSQAASVLRPGDAVTAVDLVRVRNADELGRYLEKAKSNVVLLTVEREGTPRYIILTLE